MADQDVQGNPIPDNALIHLEEPKPCDHYHYYVRVNATEFRCSTCDNGYHDGGRFIFENGKYVGYQEDLANMNTPHLELKP